MKYIGNCADFINWYALIDQLKGNPGLILGRPNEIFNEDLSSVDPRPEHSYMHGKLLNAGYHTTDSIEWINYFSNKDFDSKFADQFADYVNCKEVVVWVSSIRPGKCIPWHWDFDYGERDQEVQENKSNILRFICHIGDPSPGQIFCLEDEITANEPNGSIYQWENIDAWHGGINIGLKQKYLFNFLGIPK